MNPLSLLLALTGAAHGSLLHREQKDQNSNQARLNDIKPHTTAQSLYAKSSAKKKHDERQSNLRPKNQTSTVDKAEHTPERTETHLSCMS